MRKAAKIVAGARRTATDRAVIAQSEAIGVNAADVTMNWPAVRAAATNAAHATMADAKAVHEVAIKPPVAIGAKPTQAATADHAARIEAATAEAAKAARAAAIGRDAARAPEQTVPESRAPE